jgi:Phage protein (N4 Gp49/phage Sf6 gene 66) family
MTMNSIEQEIQAKGLTAPRITPDDIEASIASEHYFTAEHGAHAAFQDGEGDPPHYDGALSLITICVLILKNGHRIVGVNEGPVSAENFDAEIGRRYAREKAIDQVWPLLGYELRSKLAGGAA